MADREIRIRGTKTAADRTALLRCVDAYIDQHMNDGRGIGFRHGVVWDWGKVTVYVYHTKTAIVGLYRDASNAD